MMGKFINKYKGFRNVARKKNNDHLVVVSLKSFLLYRHKLDCDS